MNEETLTKNVDSAKTDARKSVRSSLVSLPQNQGPTSRFSIRGIIKPGKRTEFAINAEDFQITKETWIIGNIKIGAIAQVSGVVLTGKGKFASKIVISG